MPNQLPSVSLCGLSLKNSEVGRRGVVATDWLAPMFLSSPGVLHTKKISRPVHFREGFPQVGPITWLGCLPRWGKVGLGRVGCRHPAPNECGIAPLKGVSTWMGGKWENWLCGGWEWRVLDEEKG